jgi:hypothetical protein
MRLASGGPSIPGITTSINTRLGFVSIEARMVSAATPLFASATLNPRGRSAFARSSRMES